MGEVYRARDTRLDRTVAIKVLPETLAADPQFRERFDREARAISSLNHPHICTLHDVGRQDGIDFLVMEYLEGETLADRIRRPEGLRLPDEGSGRPSGLPIDEALQIAIQIADALATAHRAGVIHRDLKPGNIFLVGRRGSSDARRGGPSASADASADSPEPWRRRSGPPVAKLLDFGLAKAAAPVVAGAGLSMLPTTPHALTGQGTILGTFQYMAPEQLEGNEADARTDIFAFGAVLYEMLTGKKAFDGKSHASLIGAIMHAEPAPPSSVQPLAPRSVDRLVRKCLAKDPDDRWQTARDLLDELKWITDADEQAATVSPSHATSSATGASVPRGAMWRRVAFFSATTLVLTAALAASLTWLLMRAPSPPVARLTISTPSAAALTIDGVVRDMAIAPDGSRVIYVGANGTQLFVRALDGLEPIALAKGAPRSPFVSPDGQWVGFFESNTTLKKVAVTGGPALTVAALDSAPRGGTWLSDDTILFATASVTTGLQRVAAAGGTPTIVTKPDRAQGELDHWSPEVLPGGRSVLFTIAVVSADGTLAYVSGGLGSVQRILVWVDRQGQEASIAVPPRPYMYPRITPDGRRIAVYVADQENDLWLWDVDRATLTRITFDAGLDIYPVWTADGRRLIFSSDRAGNRNLFWQAADGTGTVERLSESDQVQDATAVSPDGARIIFSQTSTTTGIDLMQLQLDDARDSAALGPGQQVERRRATPLVQTPLTERNGEISPDGRWLAYEANDSEQFEIYVRPYPEVSRGLWQVSTGGGTRPLWARTGQELFYLSPTGALMRVGVERGPTWAAGTPTKLLNEGYFTVPGGNPGRTYDISPDGQRFLMIKTGGGSDQAAAPQIVVVQNWFEELKRLVPVN